MDDIYKMKLHDVLVTEDKNLFTVTLRVPGGWFYRSFDKSHGILTGCFVPFNNEFQDHTCDVTKNNTDLTNREKALVEEIKKAITSLESPAVHGLTIKYVCDNLRDIIALSENIELFDTLKVK